MDSLTLIEQAKLAMNNAFSPYSKFKVGAALITKDGRLYRGCNVENSSFGATLCAERVAFVKAISEGERNFQSLAIVSSGGDFTYPCGLCRQFISEFGLNIDVIVTNDKEVKVFKLKELLPSAFTPAALEDAKLIASMDPK